jgi:hypothetical protein
LDVLDVEPMAILLRIMQHRCRQAGLTRPDQIKAVNQHWLFQQVPVVAQYDPDDGTLVGYLLEADESRLVQLAREAAVEALGRMLDGLGDASARREGL